MRFGRYRFTPRLVPTLATAAMMPLLIGLGMWQLGRADEKRTIERTVAERAEARPLAIDAARWDVLNQDIDPEEMVYLSVSIRGSFQGERQYLLDNRTRDGVAGFHVLTAFMPEGAAGGVLVNRGWIPLGERRDRLPALPVPAGPVFIRGAIEGRREPLPLLGASGYEQQGWPKIVQRVELESIEAQLELPLLRFVVLLDAEAPAGFVREWKPYYGISVERHQAYAFQWFSLALALAVIYLVVNLKRVSSE